jgi:23S rRNA pseudouridine955/2504/2580 synthase
MSGVQTLTVAADEADLRLDRWFKRHFPTLTHGRLEKLLRTGQIRVDGKRAAAGLRLISGAAVRVPPLPQQPAPPVTEPRPVSARDARELQASVLYKDDDMLAIDKPAGLAVQGGSKLDRHLDAMLDVLSFGAAERPRLVHRLDRDTSGVLLLARNARAAAALAEAFRDKTSQKTYWAIVVGVPKIRQGRIDLPLAKLPGRAGERVVPDEEGKSAVTEYRVLDHAGQKAAWLEMWPLTGRTHQLRAHCAALGTPILGDGKYGGAKAHLNIGTTGKHLMLLARSITIRAPGGREVTITAPIPAHMAAAFEALGFQPGIREHGTR